MSVFGGRAKFGASRYGGAIQYGFDPGYVIDRCCAALQPFVRARQNGAERGVLDTVTRLTGPLDDDENQQRMLTGGTPAVLFGYSGGTYAPYGTNQAQWMQTARFFFVAIADDATSRERRLRGYLSRPNTPSLDHLPRWVLHYVLLELRGMQRILNPRPVREDLLTFGSQRFAAVVEFWCESVLDAYEALPDVTIEQLGIVHTPTDAAHLFSDDNVTPYSADDTNASPNVARLSAEKTLPPVEELPS
jgi:hypothetical protein